MLAPRRLHLDVAIKPKVIALWGERFCKDWPKIQGLFFFQSFLPMNTYRKEPFIGHACVASSTSIDSVWTVPFA